MRLSPIHGPFIVNQRIVDQRIVDQREHLTGSQLNLELSGTHAFDRQTPNKA